MGTGVAAGLSLASTGLSAFGLISQGKTAAANSRAKGESDFLSALYQSQQALYGAEQSELAADIGDLKATQTATFLRQRALGALGNIDAVLANTGTEDSSPSSWAVKNRFQQQSEEVISQTGWNARMQSKALRQQASYDRNASTLYMLSGMRAKAAAEDNASALETNGWMNAGGGVLKGLSGLKWS